MFNTKKKISELRNELDDVWDVCENTERDLWQFMQYNRRENIEIVGIPETVPDNQIERTVVNILNRMGVKIQHYDIAGCHRLSNRKKCCS